MRLNPNRTNWMHAAAVAALSLAMAGCGGGGGGDSPSGSVDVTPANQDQLSRAAAAAVQGGFASGGLPLAGAGSGPFAAGPVQALSAPLLRAVLGTSDTAQPARRRIAAVLPPINDTCLVSGSTSTTLDDRDNNGSASLGDVLTVSFNNCKDSVDETINGTFSVTLTQLAVSPRFSFTATASLNNFGITFNGHSAVYNGDCSLTYSETSATTDTTRVVVGSQLAVNVATPAFTDTITMLAGYQIDLAYDSAVSPPGGGFPGLTTTTASGSVASAAAAGKVSVRTLQPILQYDVDEFPRSGQVAVVGKNGSLQLTAVPGGLVRIDLDANGDGQFEQTKTVNWDWLF